MVMVAMVVKPARTRMRERQRAVAHAQQAKARRLPLSLRPSFSVEVHRSEPGAIIISSSGPAAGSTACPGRGMATELKEPARVAARPNIFAGSPAVMRRWLRRALCGAAARARGGAASSLPSYTSGGEENELSGTRPLATPVRERSSRSVGSRDGLSGSVELEAALRAVERNFLQPSLRRLLWASSASYNTHNNSLTQSLSNQCFRSGLNCLRQFHIG